MSFFASLGSALSNGASAVGNGLAAAGKAGMQGLNWLGDNSSTLLGALGSGAKDFGKALLSAPFSPGPFSGSSFTTGGTPSRPSTTNSLNFSDLAGSALRRSRSSDKTEDEERAEKGLPKFAPTEDVSSSPLGTSNSLSGFRPINRNDF